MNASVNNQAFSILTKISNYALEQVDSDFKSQRTAIEASRIASLNMVLDKYLQDNSNSTVGVNGLRFSNCCYFAEQNDLKKNEVKSLADFLLSKNGNSLGDLDFKLSSIFDMVSLLTEIHSLGSHILPLANEIGISPRIIGAFYTPNQVSDYIAEKTIGPVIDSLIHSIPKRGLEEYNKLLSMKVIDPACGSGAFLVSAFKIFMSRKRRVLDAVNETAPKMFENDEVLSFQYDERILSNLYGVDLDAGALEISNISLHLISGKRDFHRIDRLSNLRIGNALISLRGWSGDVNHSPFFSNPDSRCPFEWQEEFPNIFNNGGFDFVLMNPPYERLKLNKAEFMREQKSLVGQTFQEMGFDEYKARLKEDIDYFRNSGEYKLGNRYSIDTYRLFLERALFLTKPAGRIGIIVPSTLLGDVSATPLRRELILNNTIHLLNEFPEEANIFPDVTQSVCILVLKKGGTTDEIDVAFGLQSISDARDTEYAQLKVSKIKNSMGTYLTIPQIASHEWEILEKLHLNPSFGSLNQLCCRRGELDLTIHKKYITSRNQYSRLIRGSHISRYTLNDKTSRKSEYVDVDSFMNAYHKSSRIKHIERVRIACQQVSNRSQRWRLKFSLISHGTVLANSCNYVILNDSTDDDVLYYLLGILNSDLMNWRFDISNTNNHVSNRELNELPIFGLQQINSNKQNIMNEIKEEVRRLINSREQYSSFIEGSAFYLYGLDPYQAKGIMKSRSASKKELKQVIEVLVDHIQNE